MKNNRPQNFYLCLRTNKNFKTILFVGAVILLNLKYSFAQKAQQSVNDAQLWENINFDSKLSKSFTFRFSHEGRFTNNDSRLTYYFEDVGLEYKTHFHHLSILGDYVFIRKLNTKGSIAQYWDTRHQYYVALTWAKKFGDFEFHDRQMLMGQVKDIKTSLSGKIPDYYLRNKVSVKYVFDYYWSVYTAAELYWHMITPEPDPLPHVNRMRYFVGGYYRLNNKNEFELYYLFEQHMHIVNPNHNFIVGIGYSYSFY